MDVIYANFHNDVSCWKHLILPTDIISGVTTPSVTTPSVTASMYLLGIHVNKDEAKAIIILEANQNCSDCVNLLGHCYRNGLGLEKDLSKAVGLFRQAADMGNPAAMTNLGYCYKYGQGVEKDLSKAVQLYQQAADMGNPVAMFNLGYCYDNGIGVEKDISKAVQLFRQAADMGNKIALTEIYIIGEMYEYGTEGVVKNYQKSFELYVYTYEKGLEKAITKINQNIHFTSMYRSYLVEKNVNTLRNEMREMFNSLFYAPGMRGAIEAEDEFKSLC